MDTCKKRWKYLRERYVQQKKVGDSPSYEHLSRPYLEKMKFLDNFIQPRKSYRHVGLFTSPSISMNMFDGNESSKSNSSIQMSGANHLNNLSEEAYAQLYHLNQFSQTQGNLMVKSEDTSERHSTDLTNTKNDLHHNNMPSSSSSVISQESPATILSNSTTNETDEPTEPIAKRRRTNSIIDNNNLHIEQLQRLHENHQKQILNHLSDNDEQSSINNDDHSDHQSPTVPTDFLYPFYQNSSSRAHKSSEHLENSSTFPNPADFLHPFYQQATARQVRNSEQLLGELVTSELIKMTKDKKKIVQKKILEILFFDDE